MLPTLAHFTLYPPIIHFLARCQRPQHRKGRIWVKVIPSAGVKKLLRRQPDPELSLSELKVQGCRGTESVMYFNPVARFNNGCCHPKNRLATGRFFSFAVFFYSILSVLYMLNNSLFFPSCFSITNSSIGSSTR